MGLARSAACSLYSYPQVSSSRCLLRRVHTHFFHTTTSSTPVKLPPYAIERMLTAIEKYTEIKDPVALTRMKELLELDVLTQVQVFNVFGCATALQADASIYNIPLRQASAAQKLALARDIVDYMENTPGVAPNSETYKLLILAHKGSSNLTEARDVLEKLRSFDAAEVEHYTALIELYGHAGDLVKCVDTYSEFAETDLKPDSEIMSAMVQTFVKSGQSEHALMVVAKMKELQLAIPTRVLNAILTLCSGNKKKTKMVLQFMDTIRAHPDSDTLAIVNDTLDYQSMWHTWTQVAKTQNPIPTATVQLMLERCTREVDLTRINELARAAVKLEYGLRASPPLITSVLRALVNAKESAEKVWNIYESCIAIIEEPYKETFEVLICYFAIGDFSRALRLYEAMQKQQIPLTGAVCDALLAGVPRTAYHQALVTQLVRAAVQLNLCPSRAALERIVSLVPKDAMAEFTQLVVQRRAIEDAEAVEYEAQQERRMQEEEKRKQEEEIKKLEEEQRRREEKEEKMKKLEEERKKKEEDKKKREAEQQKQRAEEEIRKLEEDKKKFEEKEEKMRQQEIERKKREEEKKAREAELQAKRDEELKQKQAQRAEEFKQKIAAQLKQQELEAQKKKLEEMKKKQQIEEKKEAKRLDEIKKKEKQQQKEDIRKKRLEEFNTKLGAMKQRAKTKAQEKL